MIKTRLFIAAGVAALTAAACCETTHPESVDTRTTATFPMPGAAAMQPQAAESITTQPRTADSTTVTLESGLQYVQIHPGDGARADKGDKVFIHYVGSVESGEIFDSSRDRLIPNPFSFELGSGRVVAGMDEGVSGMRVGERRLLIIPSQLGYGERGAPPTIAPGATLYFDIELVDVNKEPQE